MHHWIWVTSLLAEQQIQSPVLRGSRDRSNPWHADSKTSIQAEAQHPYVQTLLQSCCNKTKTFVSSRLLNWAKQEELLLLLCFQCHFLDTKQVGKWPKEIISASSEAHNIWKINTYYHIPRKELEEMCENNKENMAHARILCYIPSTQFHGHNFNTRLIKNWQGRNTTSKCTFHCVEQTGLVYINVSGCILIRVTLGIAGSRGMSTWSGGPILSHRITQVGRNLWIQSQTRSLRALFGLVVSK